MKLTAALAALLFPLSGAAYAGPARDGLTYDPFQTGSPALKPGAEVALPGRASPELEGRYAGVSVLNAAVTYDPAVNAMLEKVTRRELEPAVAELSGETPALIGGAPYTFKTRSSDSGKPIAMAEQYVYEHLLAYGLDSVAYQAFPGEKGAPPGRNIIGQISGTAKAGEIVVVGAHLDSFPWTGAAPGADDNASGVSATLYLARAFAGRKFERTIRFAFFGDEENAPWECSRIGSAGYAARSKAAGENIVAMIQADALAYDPPESDQHIVEMNTRAPRHDPGGGDLAIFSLWRDAIKTYSISGLTPVNVAIGDNWSDHGSFWNNGYHAAMLSAEEQDHWNPNWHTASDKVSAFAWPFYLQVTKSYAAAAAHAAGILPQQ
ncbi:MAG: M20/M25/M40 family metallo-hydrolase [Elusimicrobiota bacterium]